MAELVGVILCLVCIFPSSLAFSSSSKWYYLIKGILGGGECSLIALLGKVEQPLMKL